MSEIVPDGWEAQNLTDIANFSGGSAFKEVFQGETSGTHPFIKVSDMNLKGNERYITRSNNWVSEEVRTEEKIKLFPSDSTVFAKVGAALLLNRRRQLVRETAIDNNMMAAIPIACDPDFLYFFMQTLDLKDIVQSGAVPSVNQSQMESIPVNTPPLPEQKKIASILTSVDEVIENTQKQIDKLQDLKKATMNELLTKGIGHTQFKDSELGRIPQSWEISSMNKIAEVIDSLHETPSFSNYGIPMVRVTDIKKGILSLTATKRVTIETYRKFIKKYKPQKGDIVMSRVGSYGVSSYISTDEQFCIGQNTVVINPVKIQSQFLYECLNSELIQRQIELEVAGSGYKSLSLADIRVLKVPFPCIEEQAEIASILVSIDEQMDVQKQKLHQTQSLKKSLMQDLLTGKVRVTV